MGILVMMYNIYQKTPPNKIKQPLQSGGGIGSFFPDYLISPKLIKYLEKKNIMQLTPQTLVPLALILGKNI